MACPILLLEALSLHSHARRIHPPSATAVVTVLLLSIYARNLLNHSIPCFSVSSIDFLSFSLLQSPLKANPCT